MSRATKISISAVLNPKSYEKISFALPKYGGSRFVFRFFGSLECSRLQNSFCPPAHSEPRCARRGANSVRAISRIHHQEISMLVLHVKRLCNVCLTTKYL